MKRIIICMDGTWQSLDQPKMTNIGIIARSVAHKETQADGSQIHQMVIYTRGVGSSMLALDQPTWFDKVSASFNRFAGGAFGEGLEDGILDTYLRLAFNYEAGDEIYIFGFSRGAYAARRLTGLINTAGIVSRRYVDMARPAIRLYYRKPKDDASDVEKQDFEREAAAFRRDYGKGDRNEDGTRRATDDVPRVKYLGVFDTVEQRGMSEVWASMTPWKEKRGRFGFSNLRVSPNVDNARHAVAIDESRIGFPCALWEGIEEDNTRLGRRAYAQRWFVGSHGDVGGGGSDVLSAAALKWIAEGARDVGLRFYATYGEDKSPLDEALQKAGYDAPISRPVLAKAWQPINYPWRARRIWPGKNKPSLADAEGMLDEAAFQRANAEKLRPRYRPTPLRPFTNVLREWREARDRSAHH